MQNIHVQYYYLAIRKKQNKTDYFFNNKNYIFDEIIFPFGMRYWVADPFVIEENGEIFIFYELFDEFKGKGTIACSKVEGNRASKPQIVIEEEFHLSFPMLFQIGETYYLIPESEASRTIILYKCDSFPFKWHKEKILLEDIKACDSVIINIDKKKLLLTSIMDETDIEGKKNYCYVHNCIYELDEQLNIIANSKQKLNDGDYGIRNAGNIIYTNDSFYRIAQNCTDGEYGKGLVVWKGESLKPYIEKEYVSADYTTLNEHIRHSKHNGAISGIHTYNNSENYEIIDFMIYNEFPYYYKLYYFIGGHLFNILKRLKRLRRK